MTVRNLHDTSVFKNKLPIFGAEEFLKCRSNQYGWLANDGLVIPYIIDKKLIFKRLIFTCGPIFLTEKNNVDYKQFVENITQYIRDNFKVDFIANPQGNTLFLDYPKNSRHIEWSTYRMDLNRFNNDEELMKLIHSKHRNVIRKARKENVQIKQTADIDEVYRCIRGTFERQNELLFPSRKYLSRLQENLNKQLLLFKAEHNNKLQGVAVIPYNKIAGYYYYGGSRIRPFTGSLNLMQFEIMKTLKQLKVKYYDFMGARVHLQKNSKFEGLKRFKSRFGGELCDGYIFYQIIRPVKYYLFELAVRLYYKKKGMKYLGNSIDQMIAVRNNT